MLSKSTIETSKKLKPNNLKNMIKYIENEIGQKLKNYNIDSLEKKDSLIDKKDEQNNKKTENEFIYYSNSLNIKLILDSKINNDKNKYNIKDNYDIKNSSGGIYLYNDRNKFSKKEICKECYQINKKIKLQDNILLIFLRKKEEKDKILILLIIEIEKEKNKDKDKDKILENKNFCYIPDHKYDIFLKKYYFTLETPQIGDNFYSYLVNKKEKEEEEIILLFWCENKINIFKIEFINDDSSIKFSYTFNLDFVPMFICPIRFIEENTKCLLKEEDDIFYTDFFLIITKENPKLCKCIEEERTLFICDAEYEYDGYKGKDDIKSIIEKNQNEVEQLDNELIAIHFKNGQKEEIALFNLYSSDFISQSNYFLIKNLQNSIKYLDDITQLQSEKNSFVMEFEEYIEQSDNINIFNNDFNLNNLLKIRLMDQIYSINENKQSYYCLELKDGEAVLIIKNKDNKKIPISKETYQKGEIFELDENNKIVLIILIKTLGEKDNISLYWLKINNDLDQYNISEFHYKIPPIKDYSCYILEKNEKKQIIMLFCCEKEIHSFKLESNNSNNKFDYYVEAKDKYIVEDELTSICSIKNIKTTDNMQEKYITYYTEYFWVSSKTNFKLFKYDDEGNIIFISDIEFEKENNEISNKEIHIKNIKQLDNGIITIHLNNKIFNSCLSPNFNDFLRKIIINLHNIFDYLEVITSNDKEKSNLIKELNEDWENSENEKDYNLQEKSQVLEKNDWENSNADIDKNYYDLDNKLLLKIIDQDYMIENQDSDYTLKFTPQGVYLKKGNKIFGKIKVSDETYQMGKVIEIENEENKKKVLAILIKNTETESNILLSGFDLINFTKKDFIIDSKIPPIKDYSFYMLDKNEKKEIIILLCCEYKIILFQFELNKSNNDDYDLKLCNIIKAEYPFAKFNPTSICPLKSFKKDDKLFSKNKVFSKYFLANDEAYIKIFKYNEEGDIVPICDVKLKDQKIQDFVEEKRINKMEQLDEGIISVHLNKKKFNCYLFLNE